MALYHPSRDDLELTAVLRALSDPHRLLIVRKLAEENDSRRCGTFGLGISKSTMTHHLRVLREAGVIEQRADGTAKLNTLRREDLDSRFPGLLGAVLDSADVLAPVG
jgi:DNA-binding transcriptional ArsR family regulator